MADSASFARHFSRLVSLLMGDSSKVDEQKGLLRALVTLSKGGSVTVSVDGQRLIANETSVPGALAGVHEVVARMSSHSIQKIEFGKGAKPAELLGVARVLAASSASDDRGGVSEQLALLPLKAIAVVFAPVAVEPKPIKQKSAEDESDATTGRAGRKGVERGVATAAESLFTELATDDVRALSPETLLARLDRATSGGDVTKALDDLVSLAELSFRAAKYAPVATILDGIDVRVSRAKGDDTKRAYALAIRRLNKPPILQGIAKLVATNAELKAQYLHVLEQRGPEGADALIELVNQAKTRADRHVLIGILRQMKGAIPALVKLLGDPRWFEARGAADLLGDLGAVEAQDALIALVHHGDDRVRRAATTALLKLNTPEALRVVHDAVADGSPAVRMQAVAALATKRDGKSAATLIRAIDDEHDGDVQVAMIAGLGKVGTSEAVLKLLKIAAPETRMFRKKTSPLRVAAVQALSEARTPAAIAALKDLINDKDRDVRDTATRALAHLTR
jgi:HEAT repeat protein